VIILFPEESVSVTFAELADSATSSGSILQWLAPLLNFSGMAFSV
jgi:hypothetical protein